MTYHTLVQFYSSTDSWEIEFGDYDFDDVQSELEDYADKDIDRVLLQIVTTATDSIAEIEAAIAALELPKAFTFEASDFIPRGVHITIYANDYAAALAEANRRIEEDEIDWEDQKSWDDGCTTTRVTGMWEGYEAYAGDDVMEPVDLRELHMKIAHEIAPLAIEPDPRTFTVFCQSGDGTGTIWIGAVTAESAEAAALAGQAQCTEQWGRHAAEGVHVLGVARGDVEILQWDDLPD